MKKVLVIIIIIFTSFIIRAQENFQSRLADSCINLIDKSIIYDPTYVKIKYPNGDVDKKRGVCTDVIIRAYRMFDIDLQREVHEDMKANFSKYPPNWGLNKPDKNIDHRRVPNLMMYFSRYGKELTITDNPDDYKPGHIVCWDLGNGILHIGIVLKQKKTNNNNRLVLHNIGRGQIAEDILFKYRIIGHYIYPKE